MLEYKSAKVVLLGFLMLCFCSSLFAGLYLVLFHTNAEKAARSFSTARHLLQKTEQDTLTLSQKKTLEQFEELAMLQALSQNPFQPAYWNFAAQYYRKKGQLFNTQKARLLYQTLSVGRSHESL